MTENKLMEADSASFEQMFPLCTCINLDRRADRWEMMRRQFEREQLNVHRLAAVEGTRLHDSIMWRPKVGRPRKGAFGSLVSHSLAIYMAKMLEAPAFILFEDDVRLEPDFKRRTLEFAHEVPDDWDVLFLCPGSPVRQKVQLAARYKRDIISIVNCCIAVREKAYDRILAAYATKAHWSDIILGGLAPQMNMYSPPTEERIALHDVRAGGVRDNWRA